MRWRQLERSSNVEDRRGQVMAIGGVIGVLALIVALVVYLVPGGDDPNPIDILRAPARQTNQTLPPADVEAGEFVEAVLGTTETYWTTVFDESGLEYREPHLVLFTSATGSGCGIANAAAGPHYCPSDETVYIDLGFFNELESRLGAGGDFAEAYVIAHEVGHHVQLLLGVMGDVAIRQQTGAGSDNSLSIALELQADCFAGTWANSIRWRVDVLEPGDIDEGLNAASAIGDDRIQKQTTGNVNPETWTHGSAEQRSGWFTTGYNSGKPSACDTFAETNAS